MKKKAKQLFCNRFFTSAILAIMLLCGKGREVARSQTIVQVGNGTATNSSVTVTPYSCGWQDSRKQYLYLASEILAAGGFAGDINAIGFNITSFYSNQSMNSFTVKLGHTLNTTFSSTAFSAMSGMSVCYSSNTSVTATGWTTHNFVNTFTWDGTSNIVVEVCFDNTNYSSNNVVQVTAQGANRVLGFGDDGASGCNVTTGSYSANRPNIRFTFASCSPPIVSVSGSNTLCQGGSTTLTANTIPGTGSVAGYQWQLNGVDIPGQTGASISAAAAGSYTVIVTNTGGCSTTSVPVNVTVSPNPAAGFTFNAIAGTVTFTNASQNGTSYSWDFGDGSPVETSANPVHVYSGDGTYQVTLTVTNACGTDVIIHQVVVIGTSINEFESLPEILIYPNPGSEMIYLKVGRESHDITAISIYSMKGEMVWNDTDTRSVNSGSDYIISTSQLTRGIYNLLISFPYGISNYKIVLK